MVQLLLDHGAKVDGGSLHKVINSDDTTHQKVHVGAVLDALIQCGADVDAEDRCTGRTPAEAAAVAGKAGILRRLLVAGATPPCAEMLREFVSTDGLLYLQETTPGLLQLGKVEFNKRPHSTVVSKPRNGKSLNAALNSSMRKASKLKARFNSDDLTVPVEEQVRRNSSSKTNANDVHAKASKKEGDCFLEDNNKIKQQNQPLLQKKKGGEKVNFSSMLVLA